MQKAEEFYKKLVDDNFEESLQSAKKQQEYIKTSTARYHGYFVPHALYAENDLRKKWPAYFKKAVRKYVQNTLKSYS